MSRRRVGLHLTYEYHRYQDCIFTKSTPTILSVGLKPLHTRAQPSGIPGDGAFAGCAQDIVPASIYGLSLCDTVEALTLVRAGFLTCAFSRSN